MAFEQEAQVIPPTDRVTREGAVVGTDALLSPVLSGKSRGSFFSSGNAPLV